MDSQDSWWTIPVASLVIVVSAVFGSADKQTHSQTWMNALLQRLSLSWVIRYKCCCCSSIPPMWQVSIFTDTILICLVATSLVHHNWYYLPPSSITNPRTLFLVFHNLFSLVFVILTLSLVMNHVWGYNLTISSVDFWECPNKCSTYIKF